MINSINLKISIKDLIDENQTRHCWFCTRLINQLELGIPYKYEENIFYAYGYFCSFPCALTYLHSSSVSNKCDQESLLYLLYYKSGGKGVIQKAPPKEILTKYGGTCSDIEYDKLLNNDFVIYQMKIPSLISSPKEINVISLNEYSSLCSTLPETKQLYFPHYAMQLKKSKNGKYRVARNKPLYNNSNLNNISML